MKKPGCSVYMDESGDLGWTLDKPYRRGGSSQYLSLGALVCSTGKTQHPKRLIIQFKRQNGWGKGVERKWSQLMKKQKISYAEKAKALCLRQPEISYYGITVRKSRVNTDMRNDPNKLYNYMTRLLLEPVAQAYARINFMPDERHQKVAAGKQMGGYLEQELPCEITTSEKDSKLMENVQFADMLAGLIQENFEDGRDGPWTVLQQRIFHKRLFF